MYPATVPVRRRSGRTAVIVVASVLAACFAGGAVLTAVNAARSSHAGQPAGQPGDAAVGPQGPGLHERVRDGKFEFVVRWVSCGHDSVGKDWFRDEPQGQFCVVELTVANIGTQAQRFADGNQKAFGPEGNLYAADTGAGVVANGNGDAIWNVVNPGNSLTATIVFDIPLTASISRLELHDSPFSRGTTVLVAADPGS